ncbi:MAG: MaoC family dehydratase N-terminal domain-containing protein [Parvibaculaceae bacterium]
MIPGTDRDATEHARSMQAQDIVSARLVGEFQATFGTLMAPADAGLAPLALHWCLAPDRAPTGDLGPDGHAASGAFLPDLGLPRRMWAGSAIDFIDPLRLGDTVSRRSTIARIERKQGRSGPFALVTVEHDYRTSRGLALRERQDLVFLATGRRETPAQRACATPHLQWSISADAPLLFRYSALTFNAHRIHYDLPYARDVEGLPGLLVHGPLQATILTHLAATLAEVPPRRMTYRATAPLVAGRTFTAAARRGGETIECWIADADGVVTMTADFTGGERE